MILKHKDLPTIWY